MSVRQSFAWPVAFVSSLLFLSGCAGLEKMATPDVDGCTARLTVSPDRPSAGFPAALEVSLSCAGEGRELPPDAVVKVFSEGQRDMQVLPARLDERAGRYYTPLIFLFGGLYHVTFDADLAGKNVHRLYFVGVDGLTDAGGD